MKKYATFATICLIAATIFRLTSCSGYLGENPHDQIPEREAQKTLQSIYLNYVASLYTCVGGYETCQGLQGTERGIYDFNTLTTDEAIIPVRGGDWYDGGFWQRLRLHSWGVHDQYLRGVWEYLYKVVVLSNKSLEVLEAANTRFDPAVIERYIAEVRAFRAIYYYYLLDLYARVPVTLSSSIPISAVRQNERSEVFDFVLAELNAALPLLDPGRSNRPGALYGRITQPVAHFVLAKMMLNAEVYTDDDWTDGIRPVGAEMRFTIGEREYNAWEAAIYHCDRIAAGGYELAERYEDNFAVFNESSPENIFVIPMDKKSYTHQMIYIFRSIHYNHAKALGMGGENGTSATLDALRIYGYGTNETDPRFHKNYYAGEVYDSDGNIVRTDLGKALEYFPLEIAPDLSGSPYEKTAGARMKKYEIDKTAIKDGKLFDNDIALFRYADVLLMKSEAKVRNGTSGDAELNEVRLRAGAAVRIATLDAILDERLLELAWEGWRRQDLVRFGKFHEPYMQRPQLPGEETAFTTVFPIPQGIIELNKNLTQNRGYETVNRE